MIGTEKIEGTKKGYKALAKDLLAMKEIDLESPDNLPEHLV